jgi:hypothetical protein
MSIRIYGIEKNLLKSLPLFITNYDNLCRGDSIVSLRYYYYISIYHYFLFNIPYKIIVLIFYFILLVNQI